MSLVDFCDLFHCISALQYLLCFWHHFRHEATCFSHFFHASDVILALHVHSGDSTGIVSIAEYLPAQWLSVVFCFLISLSSLPAMAAVHYITRQICYHPQPTTDLCPSVSLSCCLSSPRRLNTILPFPSQQMAKISKCCCAC